MSGLRHPRKSNQRCRSVAHVGDPLMIAIPPRNHRRDTEGYDRMAGTAYRSPCPRKSCRRNSGSVRIQIGRTRLVVSFRTLARISVSIAASPASSAVCCILESRCRNPAV